jgi:hypothetical protein
MTSGDWVKLILFAGPLGALVHRQCSNAGLASTLPIIGLLIGLLLEVARS